MDRRRQKRPAASTLPNVEAAKPTAGPEHLSPVARPPTNPATSNQHQRTDGNGEGSGDRVRGSVAPTTSFPDHRSPIAKARGEYFSEWRDDVGLFIPRDVVEGLVMKGMDELMPRRDTKYHAFCDVSGGRGDSAALAFSHKEAGNVVVDYIGHWKAPFDPERVVSEMVADLKRYGITRVIGDNYAGEWVASSFHKRGIKYTKSDKPKSQLYAELMPLLTSSKIQLLDHELTVSQLSSLQRRCIAGGRDRIDHPPGGHDDLANVIAGVAQVAVTPKIRIGGFVVDNEDDGDPLGRGRASIVASRINMLRGSRYDD